MRSCGIALVVTLLASMLITPAYALRPGTFVASTGQDTGACSYLAPCRNFSYAITQVQSGGVITALDGAGYGSFTIDRAVTITASPGVTPIITGAGGAAITVNALSSDIIKLNGLTLDGVGTNAYGIAFASGAELHVVNCVIRNFAGNGISFAPSVSSALMVSNSYITNNALQGILVAPQAANLALRGRPQPC